MSHGPLQGLRVLDLTRLLPGPLCTLHLADLGADVVKVEDRERGDYARGLGLGPGGSGRGFYHAVNRNKRSLAMDLSAAEGRNLFLDLAAAADAVIEGFRPGVVDRLGVGFETVRARNPRIVYCALSGYGQTGPYRDRAGHDINYLAVSGILEQQGAAGGPPAPGGFQVADLAGGSLSAAFSVVAALLDVARGGAGRYLDVSMTDCALAHAVASLATLDDTGAVPARGAGMLTGGLARYGVYETADGRHVALGALEQKFWERFCAAVGRPDLAGPGRDQTAVKAEVAALFARATQAEWEERLRGVDCCFTPVRTLDEALDDPHLGARQIVRPPGESGGGRSFAFPVPMSGAPAHPPRPAPAHGEHTDEVLREAGVDPGRIADLRARGVVGPASSGPDPDRPIGV